MPKLIGWREIMEATSHERDLLLIERLGIMPGEADECNDIHDAARLIMKKAMGIGLEKYDALQQISTHNLAALLSPDWSSPSDASRATSRQITETMIKRYNGEGLNFPAIHYLRADAFMDITGKPLTVNAEEAFHTWEIDFSDHDLIKGVKLPDRLGEVECFVLGAYSALGLYSSQNNLILNTGLKNKDFVFGTLSDCVEETFNITTTKIDNKNSRPANPKTTKPKHKLDCYIKSQAHRDFVEQYFSHYSGDGREKKYTVPENLKDDSLFTLPYETRIQLFAMGMLSSRPYVTSERGKPVLRVKRKNESYVEMMKQVCDELDIKSIARKESGSHVFIIHEKGIADVMTRDVPVAHPLLSRYPGMLQNPHQHRALIAQGVNFYSN